MIHLFIQYNLDRVCFIGVQLVIKSVFKFHKILLNKAELPLNRLDPIILSGKKDKYLEVTHSEVPHI